MYFNIIYNIIMKVVIDTDVLMSSLFSRREDSHMIVQWLVDRYARKGIKYNVTSTVLITELFAVLLRLDNLTRARLTPESANVFIDGICLLSYHQDIHYLWRPFLRDVDDDMVLETAVNAQADYIVTHNVKDFAGTQERFGIVVLSPQSFLQMTGVVG